jgi:nucleotidyltransferase substrate binding protein (TIGR01987 family)
VSAPFEHFERAVARLAAVIAEPVSMTQREASIQRFEFAFELGWKSIQATLRAKGIAVVTPRDSFEGAWSAGWFDDDAWIGMLRDRNLTSHTYREDVTLDVCERLSLHQRHLQSLVGRLRQAKTIGRGAAARRRMFACPSRRPIR